MSSTTKTRNLAPLSSLKTELPGLVDGVRNANANGCGGGGGPCLNVHTNSYLVVTFDQTYQLNKIVLFVGCGDNETMDGEILNLTDGEKKSLGTFISKGCGDTIEFPDTTSNRIAIVMTAGGGTDQNISVEEIEIYGR
jgi:hypothetical protein